MAINPVFASHMSFGFLLGGIMLRKQSKKLHASMMGIGVIGDLAIVIALIFARDALGSAVSSPFNLTQYTHIAASSLAITLYIPVIIMGFRKYRQPRFMDKKRLHMWLGGTALFLRIIGFVTMFAMPSAT